MIDRRLITLSLLLALLAACSTIPEEERKPEPPSMDELLALLSEGASVKCIEFRNIDTHQIVDEGVLSLSTRRGKHYLATTATRCKFLGSSKGTLISDGWGTLCKGTGTIVDYDAGGFCTIRNIYEFESREAAMATLKAAQARREAEALIPEREQDQEQEQER